MIAGHKILVAGGTGTIGIPIVRMLCERGANVTVVATDNEERARAVLGPEVAYQRLDLTDMSNCLSATRGNEFAV